MMRSFIVSSRRAQALRRLVKTTGAAQQRATFFSREVTTGFDIPLRNVALRDLRTYRPAPLRQHAAPVASVSTQKKMLDTIVSRIVR